MAPILGKRGEMVPREMFRDKRVCLLGNAESILNREKDIDGYDVVCRCNRGFPWGKEKFLGTRTDVLFTSHDISYKDFSMLDPSYVVWCTPNQAKLSKEFKAEIDEYFSLDEWLNLERQLQARPSTGMMAITWLVTQTEFAHLSIYGFDFWKTNTWWAPRTAPTPHKASSEKELVEWLIEDHERIVLHYE